MLTISSSAEAMVAEGNFDVVVDKADQSGDSSCNSNSNKRKLYLMKNVDGALMVNSQSNRMRVALGVLLRLVLPLANGFAKGIRGIRDVRFLQALKSIASSRQSLTNVLAYAANTISMSLSSVQVTHRIDPLLKLIKLRRGECIGRLPEIPPTPPPTRTPSPIMCQPPTESAQKFCTINVLAQPPEGTPIRADIVLIHGLHGSLANTWKQGLWQSTRSPVNFERPPKPPLRPPKRPRHSRSNIFVPPHTLKRARFEDQDHFSADGENELFAETSNDSEFSFPTFRLRIDDDSPQSPPPEHATSNKADTPTEYSKCWPGDWLPLDCPGVRVIAVNYTTDPYLWRPVWKQKERRSNLAERAREMTELLIGQRVGDGHPVVWVGHSKGGVFVKQIIVDAWESGRTAAAPLWRSARGVFFYSVPHRGSHLASINAPFLRRSVELIDIEKNNKYLLDLHRRFAGLYQMGHLKIEVFSFVETALTLMSVLYLRIVGADSADPGIGEVCGLHLDHREICKPRSRDCILYKELINMINQVC